MDDGSVEAQKELVLFLARSLVTHFQPKLNMEDFLHIPTEFAPL